MLPTKGVETVNPKIFITVLTFIHPFNHHSVDRCNKSLLTGSPAFFFPFSWFILQRALRVMLSRFKSYHITFCCKFTVAFYLARNKSRSPGRGSQRLPRLLPVAALAAAAPVCPFARCSRRADLSVLHAHAKSHVHIKAFALAVFLCL